VSRSLGAVVELSGCAHFRAPRSIARGPDLDADGVDHQRVALVMADGIPIPRRRYLRRMRLVHAHVADFMIERIGSICIPIVRKTNGTPPGQHWVLGIGAGMPLNSISPCFFTTSAACGFKIGLV
jgi:hypothetical protein